MIRRKNELANAPEENCCGGTGRADIFRIVSPDEVYADMPNYAFVHLGEGDSVGFHVHRGTMEMYTVLSGEAIYNDNGTEVPMHPGDTSVTYDGEGHGIRPAPGSSLDILACILTKH
ncbi:MAG: cupin domain-containing protein [Clostridia bacterium]|nr:cupin domain-containing protein [Clostridia bacterium]